MSDDSKVATVAVMNQQPSEAITARSPLYHQTASGSNPGKADAGVFLWEEALKSHLVLRGDANLPEFADGVLEATGLRLPGPLTSHQNEDWSLSWITPDEWLLVGPGDQAFAMEERLREHLSGHYAVINVSGGQTLVRVAGAQARTVLMKSCPYDVHDRNFPVGKVVTTVLSKSQATLRRVDEQDWELVVRRSFADYIWRWLKDASAEFGLQLGAPTAARKATQTGKAHIRAVED